MTQKKKSKKRDRLQTSGDGAQAIDNDSDLTEEADACDASVPLLQSHAKT